MNRDDFRTLLHEALTNIHDYVELEKNALNDLVPRTDPNIRKAENLKRFIWEGIELLKPKNQPPQIDSLVWRYYLVLSGRYIEGASVTEMQQRLALGERQERRLHGRACTALEEALYQRLFPSSEITKSHQAGNIIPPVDESLPEIAEENTEKDISFPVSMEALHLDKVIDETTTLFLPQLRARGGDLSIQIPANLPMVRADRIILRQILLYLLNRILQSWAGDEVSIQAHFNLNRVIVEISFWVEHSIFQSEDELLSNEMLAYWLERLGAELKVEAEKETEPYISEAETSFQIRYILQLSLANQVKILVVDDHEPAIRIFQRYLSQTNIQIVGISDPTQILSIARTQQPRAVLLDVMMPEMDGWEILQKLKADPETQHIPVIICSVWEQPDLAFSLGANGFLKKPISQAQLLDELARSNLLDISDELPPKHSLAQPKAHSG